MTREQILMQAMRNVVNKRLKAMLPDAPAPTISVQPHGPIHNHFDREKIEVVNNVQPTPVEIRNEVTASPVEIRNEINQADIENNVSIDTEALASSISQFSSIVERMLTEMAEERRETREMLSQLVQVLAAKETHVTLSSPEGKTASKIVTVKHSDGTKSTIYIE